MMINIKIDILYKIIISLIIGIALVSCEANKKVVLVLDKSSSHIDDDRFPLDSVCFNYTDSIIMYKYYPKRHFEVYFFKSENAVYERRSVYDYNNSTISGEYVRDDYVLTLSVQDTTFIYKYTQQFLATVWDYSYADSKYEIRKINEGEYITTKQSLIDSTYKEIFYYNKDFQVTKFINTYKENICIYIPNKQ